MSRNALTIRIGRLLLALATFCCGPLPVPAQLLEPAHTQAPAKSVVYVVENPSATEAYHARAEQIEPMLVRGITNVTGMTTMTEAWRSLVNTQDVVGIKVFSEPGPNSGTRQVVVSGVVQSLISAGVPASNIVVWDKRLGDLKLAGYNRLAKRFGVRLAGSAESGYDENTFYESSLIGNLVWGDFEFGHKGDGIGRKSYASKLVSQQITKIINITPLMNHNHAGVAGILHSLSLGSVDNTRRFENDASRLATAVPEIYALPVLGDRVVLNIVDALICQYEGEERTLLHYSAVLNQLWFSRDPVALDALSLQELNRQREKAGTPQPKANLELYSNAELLELGTSDLKKIQVIEK